MGVVEPMEFHDGDGTHEVFDLDYPSLLMSLQFHGAFEIPVSLFKGATSSHLMVSRSLVFCSRSETLSGDMRHDS